MAPTFERSAGFLSKVKTAVLAAIKDSNPKHGPTKSGNEAYIYVLRAEIEGQVWGGTLVFTRWNSRYDDMSEDEVERLKANAALQKAQERVMELEAS